MRSENGRESQAKSPAAPKIQIAIVSTIEMPTMRPARRDCCRNLVLSPESVMPEEACPALAQAEARQPSCSARVYHGTGDSLVSDQYLVALPKDAETSQGVCNDRISS